MYRGTPMTTLKKYLIISAVSLTMVGQMNAFPGIILAKLITSISNFNSDQQHQARLKKELEQREKQEAEFTMKNLETHVLKNISPECKEVASFMFYMKKNNQVQAIQNWRFQATRPHYSLEDTALKAAEFNCYMLKSKPEICLA